MCINETRSKEINGYAVTTHPVEAYRQYLEKIIKLEGAVGLPVVAEAFELYAQQGRQSFDAHTFDGVPLKPHSHNSNQQGTL